MHINQIFDIILTIIAASSKVSLDPFKECLFVSNLTYEVLQFSNNWISGSAAIWIGWHSDVGVTSMSDILVEYRSEASFELWESFSVDALEDHECFKNTYLLVLSSLNSSGLRVNQSLSISSWDLTSCSKLGCKPSVIV